MDILFSFLMTMYPDVTAFNDFNQMIVIIIITIRIIITIMMMMLMLIQ